ncbi:MAG: ribbon-helix-helix protein, CopG family [Pararhodobacter sp.]
MARIGRPKTDTEPLTLRLPRAMIEAIDALRRQEPDIPTRPEMIRRILVKQIEGDGEE